MAAARRFLSIVSVLVTTAAVALLAPQGARADSPLSPYEVQRVGTSTTYTATAANGSVLTGSLKSVVQTAAVNLTNGGGGMVRFFAGTYDLGGTWWEFYDLLGVTFQGAGMGQTVIKNNASNATDTEPFDMTASDRITIRDLTVDARGPLRSTSDAIDFDGGDNVLIERVEVSGSRARGIIFDGKGSGSITHADDNVVRDCYIHDIPSSGIELLASGRNLIEGCTIVNTGDYGIRVTKSSSQATQPNKPSNDNVIRNNRVEESGSDGIFINSSNRNTVQGNTVLNSADVSSRRDGIRITASDSRPCNDNIVRGNVATDTQATKTQAYGLNITSALCNRTVVGGDNDFRFNKTGTVKNSGSGTIFEVGNQVPAVSAGPDVVGSLSGVALDATVTDDGPAPLTVGWSKVSGPGGVTFSPEATVDTSAQFTDVGTYVLRLTAADGAGLSAFDEVTVTARPDGVSTVDVRVASSSDDAEERIDGTVSRSSSDLELVTEANPQVVGVRFAGVAVPAGATVTDAWVQFTTDEVTTAPAALEVRVELSGNAPALTSTVHNISGRLTSATAPVGWNPAGWTSAGAAGADQRTPGLSSAIQQVVDRGDWASGNAIVVVVTGSGTRTAGAYDGSPGSAPVLHVEYTLP